MRSVNRYGFVSAGRFLAWVPQRSPSTVTTSLLATPLSSSVVPVASSSSLTSSVAAGLLAPQRVATTAYVVSKARYHASPVCRAPSDIANDLAKDLHDIIHHDRLVVFLTGTPEQPRCGFTARLVDLLNQLGVKYSFFNIMDDDEVCEGLKAYSDWPTYPQVYVDGELLGGYDIFKEMMLNGTLTRLLREKDLM